MGNCSESAGLCARLLRSSWCAGAGLHLADTVLLQLQAQDARFVNACVSFDAATLKPKYELLWGTTGRSNALAVAEGLRFDPLVLAEARDIVSGKGQGNTASSKTRAVMQVRRLLERARMLSCVLRQVLQEVVCRTATQRLAAGSTTSD